eukprot:TRINITY_DN3557_c0_g2_i5.p2 TRINITY_DN3557_c0_g2~~TRINITY_DN3557_c0_g2_i5.p2  ORF type:complete len:427 (-),score=104.33 TRINITY_DN3557_c0_g2_i5:1495-2775(-)
MWNTVESIVAWHYEYEEDEEVVVDEAEDEETQVGFLESLSTGEFVVGSMRSFLWDDQESLESDDSSDSRDVDTDVELERTQLSLPSLSLSYGQSIVKGLGTIASKISTELLLSGEMSNDQTLIGERLDPMDMLPDECVVHILQYLEAKDVSAVGLMSTRWHLVASDEFVWRDLVQRDYLKGQKEGVLPLSNMKLEVSCKICPEQVTPYLGELGHEDDGRESEMDGTSSFFSIIQRSRWKDVYSMLDECVDVFNTKGGIQGIQQFNDRGFVDSERHQDVAMLLMLVHGLDRREVGIVVERNQQTMTSFMDLFDFEGITLVNALHMVLSLMKLPNDSGSVSQFLEALAQSYARSNPNTFEPEQAVVLLYSFLMMGATLHAQQTNNQLSLELMQNDGFDLSEEFLNTILADFGVAWPRNVIAADAPGME